MTLSPTQSRHSQVLEPNSIADAIIYRIYETHHTEASQANSGDNNNPRLTVSQAFCAIIMC